MGIGGSFATGSDGAPMLLVHRPTSKPAPVTAQLADASQMV
jgi:hypothetical protein